MLRVDALPSRARVTRLPGPPAAAGAAGAGESQDRLRILVYVALGSFAAVGVLAWLIPLIAPPATPATLGMGILAVKVAALSAGMLGLLSRPRSAAALRWLGIGFVVLVAVAMAAAEVALAPSVGVPRWGVSGIGIWIVLFPLVYPMAPRTTLAAALASASAAPAVYAVARSFGLPELPPDQLAAWMLPLYFCAGLALVAATSIHRYRTALAAAKRELRELGRYQLVKPLGSGGMGEVWVARHHLLPRLAAIKFIAPPHGAGAAQVAAMTRQFEAEARAIALLTSVHTVTLYDFGVSDDGEWYSVMELLDGIDLQQAVETRGPLPDWRVARILAQACRSLAEAHRQRLVHRDIKPGNLMLCRQGGEFDVVKVLDFGLVGLAHGGQPDGAGSSWAGSAGYVAPEVLLGAGIDGRADLYALGCVAWWLLTGKPVFAEATGAQDESVRHCSEPPPPALRCGEIDPGLAELVYALLAKRPLERPEDADAVRLRLLALPCWQLQDEPAITAWWASVPGPVAP